MAVKLNARQLRAVQAQVQIPLIAEPSELEHLRLVVPMRAMGAVRTSTRDKWDPSAAVQRYYAWRDELRTRAGITRQTRWADAEQVYIVALFKTNVPGLVGKPYREAPDADNIWKAVTDALFVEDCGIWHSTCVKNWGRRDEMAITIRGLRR